GCIMLMLTRPQVPVNAGRFRRGVVAEGGASSDLLSALPSSWQRPEVAVVGELVGGGVECSLTADCGVVTALPLLPPISRLTQLREPVDQVRAAGDERVGQGVVEAVVADDAADRV